jgi:hypothetical protein
MERTAGLYILNNRVTPVSDSNRTTIPGLSSPPSGHFTGYGNPAAILCNVVTYFLRLAYCCCLVPGRHRYTESLQNFGREVSSKYHF